ncbi:craniofacial development protein 2-like [Coccinella septempunctata]|uniref:craniofacial development protein 2-like n=1 Tax=Coccinella septempunctata TaxID=41139 RepID=UPI001D081676|nr:craniofacial development protein 2-like [Coccinella septempunctata]
MDSGGDKHLRNRKVHYSTNRTLHIATFNTRSLLSQERLTELECEVENIKWDVIGLSEVRRRGEQLITLKSGHNLYYAGEEDKSIGGTGFLIHKRHNANIVSLKKISTRVICLVLKLTARYNIKIIQIYAPTTSCDDEEVDSLYDDITTALTDKQTQYTIICGDFNAEIGMKQDTAETSLGNFGLPGRNERGEIMLDYLLQNNLFQMNSFYKKILNRRWTWQSPDGRTKNEIDYIITDKKRIVKDVTVLNRFSMGSDHRLVRAKVVIDIDKERHRMVKKRTDKRWKRPADIEGFQRTIDDRLAGCDANSNEDVNTLNDILTSAMLESQNKYCPKTQKEEKLSHSTRQMIQERRDLRSKGIVANNELKEANKKVAKAIRRDIRAFNTGHIQQTTEDNKSMRVMRRKLGIGKKHIIKLKTKQGITTTNREEILKTVEDFYQTLYTSQNEDTLNSSTKPDIVTVKKGVVNQGSEELPCITID